MYPKVGLVGLPSSILPCGGVCHMKRLRLAVSVFLFVSALVILGCSVSNNPPFQATGTLTTIQTGDAVNDQILKFELTISSITLTGDRKSTRLNSSHGYISYAVFCLKKKISLL